MAGNSHRELPNGQTTRSGYDIDSDCTRGGLSRRSVLATTGAGIVGSMFAGFGTVSAAESGEDGDYHLKTRPTLYTEEMRDNAARNIDSYDWAASERDGAVSTADSHLSRWGPDLEELWSWITSQKIPRGRGTVAQQDILGGFNEPGTDRVWKIETTVENPHGEGNLVVPTNDFESYRESGLDERGMFDPDLADDQYLVNEEHPEMGEGWGVDDGWGWYDEENDLGAGEGARWNFVAYYNHWFVWRPRGVDDLVPGLADAYLLTGESEYAVAGLVLLDRIADVYPEMDLTEYTDADGFDNNHGGRQTGRIIGGSWETNLVRPIIEAYDAFFPALDDEAVADELLEFLQGRIDEYPELSSKESVQEVRENIEENFIMEMLPAAKNSNLVPERGQRPTVAVSARVQDDVRDDGYTREALEWLFQPGGEIFDGDVWDEEPENWNTTGGELLVPVVDNCDRDGYWHEAAVGYNRIQMSSVRQVAEVLQGYDGFDGADLYQHPKFQHALKQNAELLLLDELTPEIGDEHHPTGAAWSGEGIEDGYETTGMTIFAQLLHYSNGYSTDGMRGNIFDADPTGVGDDIQEIIDAEGPLDLPSQNLAGYGFAALRDGKNYPVLDEVGQAPDENDLGNEKRAVWLYYGRNNINAGGTSHNHGDTLNLGVMAHEMDLSPDLGYPEQTGDWPKHAFTKGTISHNTVTVDAARQDPQWVADPRHFDGSDERVNLIDVDARHAYDQTDEYRRTTAMITVDERHSYAVDFFRVAGGDDHVFSFHGQAGEMTAEGVDLVPQDGGTYAGEDVPKPDYGEETEYSREVDNGYNYLDNVSRDDDPSETVAVEWDVEDHWNQRGGDADGVHLRLTTFGEFDEVALADGNPPDRDGNPDTLGYALVRREGSDLESTFTSVIEHWDGDRAVASAEEVPVSGGDAHAVKVELENGRTDYVVCAFDEESTVTVDNEFQFQGFFGVYSLEDGDSEYAYVHDGRRLQPIGEAPLVQESQGFVRGFVEDFTREMSLENELELRIPDRPTDLEERISDFVYIDNDGSDSWRGDRYEEHQPIEERNQRGLGNGAYPVEDVTSGRGNAVTIDVGERTFVRQFADPEELEDGGYEYIIQEENDVRVPLVTTWSA